MEAELQSRHLEPRKLKQEMIKICHQMKEDIGLILLSIEEEKVLSFGLNQHIPTTLNRKQSTHGIRIFLPKNYTSHLLEDDVTKLKTKLPNTCEKYNYIKSRINIRELLTLYDKITAL